MPSLFHPETGQGGRRDAHWQARKAQTSFGNTQKSWWRKAIKLELFSNVGQKHYQQRHFRQSWRTLYFRKLEDLAIVKESLGIVRKSEKLRFFDQSLIFGLWSRFSKILTKYWIWQPALSDKYISADLLNCARGSTCKVKPVKLSKPMRGLIDLFWIPTQMAELVGKHHFLLQL